LKAIAKKHVAIQDVRGFGAMVAIELFQEGDRSRPDADLTKRLCAEAAKRGLILLSCGSYANVIRVLVPLTPPMRCRRGPGPAGGRVRYRRLNSRSRPLQWGWRDARAGSTLGHGKHFPPPS
jgi:hypothetical protein